MSIRVGKILCIITVVIVTIYLWGMIFYNGPFKQAGLWNALLACVWEGLVIYLCRLKTYGLSFEELRQRCLINEAAEKAHRAPNFSEKIREGRPN